MEQEQRLDYNGLMETAQGMQQELTDAQATIVALQARVQELEQWVQDQSTANLETMRHTDEMQSRALEAEQHLTQRTAECDALKLVNDTHMKTVMKLSHIVEQQTAELEATKRERDHAKKMEVVQKEVADNQTWHVQQLRAELERVRGERDRLAMCGHDHSTQWWQVRYEDLATLVAALPKVEGEIVAQAGYVKDRKKVYACFGSDADMTAYAALLTHRQGMEG